MLKSIVAAAALLLSSTAFATSFVAGQHYDVVADTPTEKPEVREFFSFYCPHCYHFETTFRKVIDTLPKTTTMVKNHVDFMGFASQETQTAMTRNYVAAAALGKGHEATDAFFNAIHEKGARPNSEADVRAILVAAGISGDQLDKQLHSDAVNAVVSDMQFQQSFWSKSVVPTPTPMLSMMLKNEEPKPVLSGVPTVIINGKYRINLSELKSDNFAAELTELVQFLLKNPK